ncbi:MAG: cation:proton antiporter [Acidobacteriota bacterium]
MIPLILLFAVGGLMHAVRSYTGVGGTDLAFGYLLLAAYFTGKIVSRFGMPKLTGYLIAGVVSGPYVLDLVTHDMGKSLKIVSNVATCIIALTAGSELNLKKLRPRLGTLRNLTLFAVIGGQLAITAALFVMKPALGFMDGMSMNQTLAVAAVLGVALSAQSPAVVMALLAETGAEGPLSQVLLGSVVLADLVVLVMYSVVSTLAGAVIGGGLDVVETGLSVGWELFGSMGFGIAIGMLIARFLLSVKRGAPLFAVMVCVVVAEIGVRIELDPLIVMLAAGIWLENFSRANAADLLHGFESAQLPVFLVFFGLAGGNINLHLLYASLLPVLIVVAVRACTFYLGAKTATARSSASSVVAKYAWAGLMPQSGLALALALLVQNTFPTFGPAAAVIVFGVVAVNELIAPVVLRTVLVKSGEAGKRAAVQLGH